ncbi:MAG: biopolymer transporter ExbD [Gemmatimonadales bacterium]|nr:biopolymer transporter ExbD [Gemmatimonadales bacterium]
MAISTSSKSNVNADINVTPMADVMLVLLIIFMITAPLIASGFVAQMPEGINLIKAEEDPDDVTLGLDKDGNYYINTRPYAKSAVQAELTRIYNARTKDKILYLKADVNLTMEKIQEAISMARAAGVRVVAAVADQRMGTAPTVSVEREGRN